MGFWSDRKERKAREARERAQAATDTYLLGVGINPYGYDAFGAPLSVPAERVDDNGNLKDSPYPDPNDVPANEHDTLRDSDIHTSESYGTSQDTTPSYDYSSNDSSSYSSDSYSSGSDSSSSYDSGSSGGSDF